MKRISSNRTRSPWIILLFFVLATPAFAGDVTLAWDPNSESDIAYKLYYGNSSGNYGTPVPVGSQTSHTVNDLAPGTYFFAVTAVNLAGLESGFSNEVSATVNNSSTDCDINTDGNINVLDLQVLTNTILGSGPCPGDCDINGSGSVDALDVQLLVNIVLGVGSCPQ